MRDLNEFFVNGQTTVLSFGGASVAQFIKMMEFQSEDHEETRGAVHDTTEPGVGHAVGGFYERQRDPLERDDPQSGEKQSQRAANHGS